MRASKILYGGEKCFFEYNPLVTKLVREDMGDVPLEEDISFRAHLAVCNGCRGRYIKLKEVA